MGICHKSNKTEDSSEISYENFTTIEIKLKLYNEKVSFQLNSAEKATTHNFSFTDFDLFASGCVIPGQDPRKQIEKQCQDNYLIESHEKTVLFVVFDGHGKHGREVVLFCADFMSNFYKSSSPLANPEHFLQEIIQECDKALFAQEQIDISTSGTTSVLILISDSKIWSSSVGDSRVVLGCLPKHDKLIETSNVKSESHYKRPLIPLRYLKSVQLSLDQKPNISYELERIIKSGGIVQQLSNSEGNKIGPYRIWTKSGKVPGLAMSRSIGDKIAKSIGVIPEPIIYSLPVCLARDQFLVIASDGVWDVLANTEAVYFVDKYRKLCRNEPFSEQKKASNSSNSVIAELLCEEARFRWFGVCEEEDVAIDDISCIVIEFKLKDSLSHEVLQRKGITIDNSLEQHIQNEKVITLNKRFDLKRGSNAAFEEIKEEDDEED